MLKKGSLLLILFAIAIQLDAQYLAPVQTEGRTGKFAQLRMPCENEAGTVDIFNSRGNLLQDSPIYLAFGDSLRIDHEGGDVSNDPNTTTLPGIGYIFYDCAPSVAGPTFTDVQADTCINRQDSIFLNGRWEQRDGEFWATRGENPNGDIIFLNDGTLQTAFNNGELVQFWYAPVTFNYFDSLRFEEDPMTGQTGPCINVGVAEAFSVVYLNEIEVSDVQNSREGLTCIGSFSVAGGLPAAQPGQSYTIELVNSTDPSVRGTVENAAVADGDSVNFFVPEPGLYTIIITDDAGSETTTTVDMAGCEPVTFSLPFRNALPATDICLPVTVENFTDVGVMQFDINYDPSVLSFNDIQNIDSALAAGNLSNSSFTIDQMAGSISLSWPTIVALSDGINLPDSTVIFELCFSVTGNFGEQSPVTIVESAAPIETIGNDTPTPLGYIFNSGQVNVSNEVLFNEIVAEDISCHPGNNGPSDDGAISITLAEGAFPYSVTITPPVGGPINATLQEGVPRQFTGLAAGEYMVFIRDNASNTIDTTLTIIQPDEFVVQFDRTNPTCFNLPDGTVRANVLLNGFPVGNPEALFSFEWSYSDQDTSVIDSVLGGIPITVSVVDQNGCTETNTETLSNPAPISFNATITDAQCSGQDNGAIDLTVSKPGYTGTFDLSWATLTEDIGANNVVKSNLLPGTYSVTATDAVNCSQVDSFTVGAQKTLIINTAVDSVLCFGDANGQILASGSSNPTAGEALPYTFSWAGPTGTETASDNVSSTYADLIAGTYTVTMQDADNCATSLEVAVAEPDPLAITLLEQVDETCNDDDNDGIPGRDGLARVEVSGGTAPYTYLWTRMITRPDTMFTDTVSVDSVAMNLQLSTYRVLVTDANGCIDSLMVDINAPAPPQIISFENDTLRCNGDLNGALSVTAMNGNGNITSYEWDNGAFGPSITNLSPGIYRVRIAADDGCVTVDSALVFAPPPTVIDSITAVQPRCPGSSNGSLTVFANGGTAPYTYIWQDTPLNDTTFNSLRPGLAAGSYQVTVVDANRCAEVVTTQSLEDPPQIELAFSDILPVSCFAGSNDGEARVSVDYADGTTGLFTINWASGAFAEDTDNLLADNLSAGFNVITAIDGNNCSATDSVEIPSPPPIELSLSGQDISCNGQTDGQAEVVAAGGTPPFRYNWPQTGAASTTVTNLGAGTYVIEVIDDRDCIQQDSITITEPDALNASINLAQTNDPLCFGDTNGQIAVQVNTDDNINPLGSAPYTWSNGAPADSAIANDLPAGSYGITVTDINGCTDQVSFTLTEPTPVQAVIPDPADPRCFGETTPFTVTMASGGVGMDPLDYTFQIDRNGLNFPLGQQANIFAGAHIITIEDPNGCTFEDSIFVDQPEQISVAFTPANVTVELGDSMYQLNPEVTSSLPLDSIIWSPGDFLSATNILTPIVEPLENTQYTLTITDINGCTASASVLVELDRNRNVYVPNGISPNGDGRNDEFRVYACRGVRSIQSARLFDRWGGLIYEGLDLAPVCDGGLVLWDGEINGQEAPIGVYVYVIEVEFIDGVTFTYRGDVTVVR